jgi:hypothetical protein
VYGAHCNCRGPGSIPGGEFVSEKEIKMFRS